MEVRPVTAGRRHREYCGRAGVFERRILEEHGASGREAAGGPS